MNRSQEIPDHRKSFISWIDHNNALKVKRIHSDNAKIDTSMKKLGKGGDHAHRNNVLLSAVARSVEANESLYDGKSKSNVTGSRTAMESLV